MRKKLQNKKELQKEFWKVGNTLFWSLNVVILFSVILDVILLSKDWLDFVLLKLVLLLLFYVTYNVFKKKYATPNILIHLILFSFNFLALISISHSGITNRIIYTSLLIALFVAFNTMVIWSILNSVIQYGLVILTFTTLVFIGIINDPFLILKEGGYLFLILGLISLFFPKIRKKVLIEKIESNLATHTKVKYLEDKLYKTQNQYNSLQKKVEKKENESKFLFQQLSNDLNNLNNAINNIDTQGSEEKKKDLVALIQNLRNQSSIYFKPTNLNTENASYLSDYVDIKQVYLEVFSAFSNKIKEKNITGIDRLIATNTLIAGNERIFKTIIYNILNFMVVFSNEDEKIEVTLDNIKEDVVFSVANKTQGIKTEEIESYFRDIEFVNYDYKKHSDSLKIGLRISKQLTEKMNGYFSYVSSEKMGFELKIEFKTYKQN
ncbi:ATP-binding protein [Algibacter pacificus]|uniref:ATP-binding protein n=1 Tax=Algibacter pacificus TaxID=2599389 RepID=UPI0011C94DCB|nr:ATP-binding protein [Algibacter pacificus]